MEKTWNLETMPLKARPLQLWICFTSGASGYTAKVVLGRWGYLDPDAWDESISHSTYPPLFLFCLIIYIFYNVHLKAVFLYSFLYWKCHPWKYSVQWSRGWGWRWGSESPRRTHWLSRLSKQTPKSGLEPNLLSASSDGIPRSYYQLVKRNHSKNCKLASKNCKDSFTWKLMPANII